MSSQASVAVTTPTSPLSNVVSNRDALNPYQLIIFDFDGTLFDTHASISYCIEKTFSKLGQTVPAKDAVDVMVSTGVGLEDAFRLLEANYSLTPDGLSGWISAYREIYKAEGIALIQSFPGASALFSSLAATKILIAVVSNKGISAIEAVLSTTGLSPYVDQVVGDMPGMKKKPDPMSFHECIVPKFAPLDPKRVMVVGDTTADIQYAQNIGAHVCWAAYGYGEQEKCRALMPDFTAQTLMEVRDFVSAA